MPSVNVVFEWDSITVDAFSAVGLLKNSLNAAVIANSVFPEAQNRAWLMCYQICHITPIQMMLITA